MMNRDHDVNLWFQDKFPAGPTAAQNQLWPVIRSGHHALLAAPTGTGKTLAAILPVYQKLFESGEGESTGIHCLYISPLRALSRDVALRVKTDLDEIHLRIPNIPKPSVELRTGDTKPHQRTKMMRNPPEILVTTPESLLLLLVSGQADALFASLQWIIVDEVHSFAGTKRGVELAFTLERLTQIARKVPQRIGLSATCHPIREAGNWLAGTNRPITILSEPDRRPWQVEIEFIPEASKQGSYLSEVLRKIIPIIEENETTLLFTNIRSTAERITWLLRKKLPYLSEQIGVHHGALSPDVRQTVENKLQKKELRAVVSSSSLELGIDIGCVDHVVLMQLPGGTNRLLQRLGRSSHRPDGLRKGTILTTTQDEFQEAMVTRSAGHDALLEPICISDAPLDVLCQQMIATALSEKLTLQSFFHLVRQAYPFRHVTLKDVSDCLEFLTGGRKVKELPRRLSFRDGRMVPAQGRLLRLYRTNLGTISDEGMRVVRRSDNDKPLGSVTDYFADHLKPGDRFLLEGRVLEIVRHEAAGLAVSEETGMPMYPHWQGGLWPIPQTLAERIWHTRCHLHDALLESELHCKRFLVADYRLNNEQADSLIQHLQLQESFSEIPRDGLLIEAWGSESGESITYALHMPLAPAAAEAVVRVLAERLNCASRCHILPGMLGAMITLPGEIDFQSELLRKLLMPDDFDNDLDRSLSQTIPLARRFQECGYNSLMLLRRPLSGKRRTVGGKYWAGLKMINWFRFAWPEFCLLRQAYKEAREDIYYAKAVKRWLHQLKHLPIKIRQLYGPSPFAGGWLPNSTLTHDAPSHLSDLLQHLVENQSNEERVPA